MNTLHKFQPPAASYSFLQDHSVGIVHTRYMKIELLPNVEATLSLYERWQI